MLTLLCTAVTVLLAAGSGTLVCFLMRCRTEEAIAHERSALGELRSILTVQRQTLQRAIDEARAEARRAAFDEFLHDFRVEQKYHVRRSRLLFLSRKTLVLRERVLFRNLPVSSWMEHATTLEEFAGTRLRVAGPVIDVAALE